MSFESLLATVRERITPPVVLVLGSPLRAADLVLALNEPETVCYQLDLYQAERLREELTNREVTARIETLPDLWDLPAEFQTAILPIDTHGERELKVDMLEQVYHILKPQGLLVSLSKYVRDQLCPRWHKKVFGKCSEAPSRADGSIFWSVRGNDQPRRRHEQIFHARIPGSESLSFVSRPGVFCYGRFDDGARALVECAEVPGGAKILDLGCGVGTNGIFAAKMSGPKAEVTFLDSNVRAIALAELNARNAGITNFRTVAARQPTGLPGNTFDVVLTNPPYFANASIARMFIEQSRPLLRRGGRFYLVTKQVHQIAPMVEEVFGNLIALQRRGYIVLYAES